MSLSKTGIACMVPAGGQVRAYRRVPVFAFAIPLLAVNQYLFRHATEAIWATARKLHSVNNRDEVFL